MNDALPEAIKADGHHGFSRFKIEGRSLGSAVVFGFLHASMTKPEYRLSVRKELYLDSSLDHFRNESVRPSPRYRDDGRFFIGRRAGEGRFAGHSSF